MFMVVKRFYKKSYMNIYAELTKYHKQDFKETIELAAKINMAIPNIYYKLLDQM